MSVKPQDSRRGREVAVKIAGGGGGREGGGNRQGGRRVEYEVTREK